MRDFNESTATWLCLFFGIFGIHRLYMDKIGTGIFMLCTSVAGLIIWLVDALSNDAGGGIFLGLILLLGMFIWALCDFIRIVNGWDGYNG